MVNSVGLSLLQVQPLDPSLERLLLGLPPGDSLDRECDSYTVPACTELMVPEDEYLKKKWQESVLCGAQAFCFRNFTFFMIVHSKPP